MKLNLSISIAALAIVAVAPSVANATVAISNTGNNTAWTVSGPTFTGTAVTVAPTLPSGWLANTAASSWVSINSAGTPNATGAYSYTTDFTAAVGDSLTFRYAVDDSVSSIVLNGNTVFSSVTGTGTYSSFTTFTLTGFRQGANNLVFNTINQDVNAKTANPSGFRFEAAVPEPASWAMMVLGFGVIGGALRVSRRKVVFA